MDVHKVNRAVADLTADYERRDGYLTAFDLERIAVKRQLTVEERTEILSQLEALGVSVEENSELELPDFVDDQLQFEPDNDEYEVNDTSFPAQFEARLKRVSGRLLTPEQEIVLGRRMELGRRAQQELQEGCSTSSAHNEIINLAKQAKEEMISSNLRLVFHVARPYSNHSSLDLDDLFQEGVLGLIRACEKFDHTLGYKFSTYATWWIRQAIDRAMADKGMTIRLPVHVHGEVRKFRRACRILSNDHPLRRVTIADIANELDWPLEKVHFIQEASLMEPLSLDDSDKEGKKLGLSLSLSDHQPSPERIVLRQDLSRCLKNSVDSLKAREAAILRLRFGLSDFGEEKTLEEIGRMYGVSRERIRQIESQALGRLSHPCRSQLLRDFLDLEEQ